MSACATCAFRPGSVTHDQEVYNALRGMLCALGAVPFYCHHGHNWEDANAMLAAHLCGPGLELCEGWKAAVAENKAKHLFDDPGIRRVRRIAADRALVVIEEFIAAPEGSPEKAELNRELGSLVYLLAAPPEAEAA